MKQFNKAWEESTKSIFRLELLPEYNVPGDLECYQKFLEGEDYMDDEFREWFKKLRDTNKKGVRTERVRIYSLPVNDYIKYEIDVWKPENNSRDSIYFMDQEKYNEILKDLKISVEDFWLFDDSVLVVFHYSLDGAFIEEEKIVDKELIEKFVKLKYKLINSSVNYSEFIKNGYY